MIRKRISVKGVVQGVGFRPHVYRLAVRHSLSGWVRNDSAGVTIEAEGTASSLEAFVKNISFNKPAASRVDSVSSRAARPDGKRGFAILKSGGRTAASAIIPADLALCEDCRRELLDRGDRRYLYPFTNCTNCGPRFTIVRGVPYDRPATTMAGFKMCPACRGEYGDPLDRRFHAQPNACPVCGPEVKLYAAGKTVKGPAALEKTAALIISGGVGALQSLGGFHLCCRADSVKAVGRLRRAKERPDKPFAVMVPSLAAARRICSVSALEAAALAGSEAPVVMLRRSSRAFEAAAPGLSKLGVMLPYTPLHAALFALLGKKGFTGPLIMTSGNFRDEPICKDIPEVRKRLYGVASFSLSHDRPIHNRADDSVAFEAAGELRLARRARGYVPGAVKLASGGRSVLACGADLKNTFCLTRGSEAFLSQHIGDLSEPRNQDFFRETLSNMRSLLKVSPEATAYDLHPGYASSALALALPGTKVPVQHHAAHALSVAAEHKLEGPFIAAAFDGTGYGTDGRIWGGEFLIFRKGLWSRAGHLKYFRLPGGEAAVHEIWRAALSLLSAAHGGGLSRPVSGFFKKVPPRDLAALARMQELGFNSPETSSMGRLFDAVSCIAGLRREATYEGQAPMELESLFKRPRKDFYKFGVSRENGLLILDPAQAVLAAFEDRKDARLVSERFHCGLAAASVNALMAVSSGTGIKDVCLSGGVFQNRTLLELVLDGLARAGLRAFTNRQVPANDGGLALGQAWYALKGYRPA